LSLPAVVVGPVDLPAWFLQRILPFLHTIPTPLH